MHYGEHAILGHYMSVLIFFFLGIMFLLLYPLLKERSKFLGYTALTSGIVVSLCSLFFIIMPIIDGVDGIFRLFRVHFY